MDYPFDDEIEIGHVYLDSQKFTVSRAITGEFMSSQARWQVDQGMSFLRDEMVLQLNTRVRVHNLPPEQVAETVRLDCTSPATWWQQWKQDVAAKRGWLSWIVSRWPVKTRTQRHTATVTLDLRRFRVYPDAPNIGHLPGFALNYMNHTWSATERWDTQP